MIEGDFYGLARQIGQNEEEDDALRFELNNKMKVMLINKYPNFSKISVALDIHIGNYDNPDDFPGLAYLCQRMIVLGNDRYPEYKGFHRLVHAYGGDISLTTTSDHTTFYFHIYTRNDIVFNQVLDYFVNFFISSPRFEKSWIEEEIQRMDLKLKEELLHEMTWFEYFERSTVNSTHPYSKYSLCKREILETMPIEKIKFMLFNFFIQYYSANIMTLCIVSDYKPNEIKETVINMFDQILNWKNKSPKSNVNPFKDELSNEWYIAPKTYARNLILSFPLPNTEEDEWCEAVNCISFFLTCNNDNSLLETLKAKHWCSNISTNTYQEAKGLNFFHINITLLEAGYSYIYGIISLVFEYLNLFKTEHLTSEEGKLQLEKILYNIYKYKRFKEKQTFSQQRIIKIAKRMHENLTKNVLSNQYSHKFANTVSAIKKILEERLVQENIRVYVINNDYKNLPSKSPGLNNAQYMETNILKSDIDSWKKDASCSKLILPDLKCFLNPDNPLLCEKLPEIIADTLVAQLWYTHAIPKLTTIQLPTKMFFHFISPHVYDNPLNTILNYIYAKLLKDDTKEEDVPQNELEYQLKQTNYGILLEVNSYVSVTYHDCLSDIISKIVTLQILPEKFENAKREIIDSFKSFKRWKPENQAFCYLRNLLSERSWPCDALLKASVDVTIDEMKKFVQKFVDSLHVKSLIYGEISKEQALIIIKSLEYDVKAASSVPTMRTKLLPSRELKLEDNINALFEEENEFHKVTCTKVYYQVGKETLDANAMLALIRYIMSKRCLKYFKRFENINEVSVRQRKAGGMQGLIITVESLEEPSVIQYHIQEFIYYMLKHICRLSKAEFKEYKTNVITSTELKLNDIAGPLWVDFPIDLHISDQQEIKEKYIKDIKQISLIHFYKEYIFDKNAILSVHISSKSNDESKSDDLAKDDQQSDLDKSVPEVDEASASSKSKSSLSKFMSKIHKYFEEVKIWSSGSNVLTRDNPDVKYQKIDDILQFKQTRGFHDYD